METCEHRGETSLKKQFEKLDIAVEFFLYEFEVHVIRIKFK